MAFIQRKSDSQSGDSGPKKEPTPASASDYFRAWLETINSYATDPAGNSVRPGRFLQQAPPQLGNSENSLISGGALYSLTPDGEVSWKVPGGELSWMSYIQGGGLDLRRVDEETATRFVGILQDRVRGLWSRVVFESEPKSPSSVRGLEYGPADAVPGFEIPRMSERDALAAFRQRLDDAAADEAFSGAVLVAKNGVELFTGTHGFANRERGIPNRLDSRFRIATMTRMFTSVAVLQLVQGGMLGLHEPFGPYLPDYPDREIAGSVTPFHLITHTRGLTPGRYRKGSKALEGGVWGPIDPAEHVGRLAHVREREPDSKWGYSNYAYALLGYLIGRLTGQDYYDYMSEHVFGPADMESSGFEPDETRDRDSTGYRRDLETGEWHVSPVRGRGGPGGMSYTTVEDLKRFADALFGHRLLDEHHTQLLLEPKQDARWGGYQPCGLECFDYYGMPWYGRTGIAECENVELRVYPKWGYVIAVLTNMGSSAALHMARFIGDRLPAT